MKSHALSLDIRRKSHKSVVSFSRESFSEFSPRWELRENVRSALEQQQVPNECLGTH